MYLNMQVAWGPGGPRVLDGLGGNGGHGWHGGAMGGMGGMEGPWGMGRVGAWVPGFVETNFKNK